MRLTAVQRMILTFMAEQGKQGKATIISSGHRKTRIGEFPKLQAQGVVTNSTTLFFLKHHGFIGPVGRDQYRLTAKGEEAIQ